MFLICIILIDAFSFTNPGDDILGRVFFATGYRQIGSGSIVPAIKKTEKCGAYSKLILGDSVCNQVFNQFADANDEYLVLATNQAITITGQYILASRFLENSGEATDIYIVMLPGSFSSDYSSELSYSYLIEPFGKMGCFSYLSEDTRINIEQYYGRLFTNTTVLELLDNSCSNNKLYLYYNQNRDKICNSTGAVKNI